MKKICFMMPTVFNIGGEQRVVSSLSSALCKAGYDVTLLLFNCNYEENYDLYNLNKSVKIKYIKNYYGFLHKTCRRLRNLNAKSGLFKKFTFIQKFLFKWSFPYFEVKKELKDIAPDILIGVSGDYTMLTSFLKKELSVLTIGWQHSCHDAYFNTKGNRHINEKKAFCSLIKNGIDKYVVLTRSDKEKFEKEFGIPIYYVYNIKSFETTKRADLDAKQIIAAGRMVSLKGFDLLVDAFKKFNKKFSDWHLKIVGDGEEKSRIEELIKEYNLENNVTLMGYCDNMEELYSESSIYVLSSKWEGFPMVLTECMEMGLPIISFDIDVMKEFIVDEVDGLLVPKYNVEKLAKVMEKLASSRELRQKISNNELTKVKLLSENNIILEWKKIFGEE